MSCNRRPSPGHGTVGSLIPAAILSAIALFAAGTAAGATPPTATLSEANPTVTWTGAVMAPTAGPCGSDNNPACDNFKLAITPPSAAFGPYLVEVHLQPQGDWDLEMYGPDHTSAGGSGNGAGQLEVAFLVNPPGGVYTITATPFSPTGGYSASATLKKDIIVPARQGTESFAFANYAAPSPLGTGAGEPSIGVSWKTGNVMFEALNQTLRVKFDDCTLPATATWADKSAPTSVITLDPILFTDSKTGRTVVSQLVSPNGQGIGCSLSSYTDDDGETWIPSQGCGTPAGADHQSVGGGPFHAPLTRDPNGPVYPDAVYYCSQSGVTAFCARSDDGGLTYGPGVPIYTSECGGLHGHVKVAPDGTVYVPNRSCFANQTADQAVVVSEDNGLTWTVRHVPFSFPGANDPSVGIGADGTVYFGYQNGDGRPKVAISRDRGQSWEDRGDVGTPFGIQNTVFPVVAAGDAGRAAFSFLGTPSGGNFQSASFPGVWHLYSSHTYDGGQTWTTVDDTPADPVQRGCIWLQGGSNPCRNLLDFMDTTVDRKGRVLVGYPDGCVDACVGGLPNSYSSVATIARQSTGRGLFAAFDSQAGQTACPPIARDDSATTPENTPVTINVLANDSDGGTPPLTITGVTQPSGGTATNNGNGTVTYSPNPNFNTFGRDADVFTYTVSNGTGATATAAVRVTVTPFCPLAATGRFFDDLDPQRATYKTSSTRSVGAWAVQIDPTAHSPNHAWVVLDDQPGVPTLTQKNDTLTLPALDLSSSSVMNFWHNFDFARFPGTPATRLRYQSGGVLEISGDGGSSWKDLGPFITAGGYNGTVDPGAQSPLKGLPAWVGSSDGDLVAGRVDLMKPVSANLGAAIQSLFGTAQLRSALIRFRLGGTFQTLIGGIQGTGWGVDDLEVTNTLQVTTCDHPPIAKDDSANATTATPVTIAVLANDSDPDGDPLTVTAVTSPANGTATINGAGPNNTVTYKSNSGFIGTDTFNYTVSDGRGQTASAKVTVTVTAPPNRPPVANNDMATTAANTPVTINVLANDSDPDGDPLTISSVTPPSHGTATASATQVTYTPASNFVGTDTFQYTITDGRGGSASATVTVTVTAPPNRPPVARDDSAMTPENTSVTIDVLANDSDPDGDSLTITGVTQPSSGTSSTNGSNVTYSPNSGFVGSDTFTYSISDGHGGVATARVTVIVTEPGSTGKATGGGWIPGSGGTGKSNFGFNAQPKSGAPKGNLKFDSSDGSVSVKGDVDALSVSGIQADFGGPCTMDRKGTVCRYAVHVEDHGEPGAGADRFRIQVFNGGGQLVYQADAPLGGGNIQIR